MLVNVEVVSNIKGVHNMWWRKASIPACHLLGKSSAGRAMATPPPQATMNNHTQPRGKILVSQLVW